MRQKKNRKKKKNRKIRILTGVVLGVGLAGALFFNVFKIRNIQVLSLIHISEPTRP